MLLVVNCLGIQMIVVVNGFKIQVVWLPSDLRFK